MYDERQGGEEEGKWDGKERSYSSRVEVASINKTPQHTHTHTTTVDAANSTVATVRA